MLIIMLLAVAVGAALGWKARARGFGCGILCDPDEARVVLAHHHADGYELGVRDGTRYQRGSLDDPAARRRVRSVLDRPRVTFEGEHQLAA